MEIGITPSRHLQNYPGSDDALEEFSTSSNRQIVLLIHIFPETPSRPEALDASSNFLAADFNLSAMTPSLLDHPFDESGYEGKQVPDREQGSQDPI